MKIEELLARPEGKTLEFKLDLSSPKNILRTLTAFANTAGGVLLVGIEDGSKAVIGVKHPLDEEERLCNLIADAIEPRLAPSVELVNWKGRTLLAVEAYPSALRPHWLKSQVIEKGVLVRVGSTNRQADGPLTCALHASLVRCAAPSALNHEAHPYPGLTAGPIHCRRFAPGFRGNRRILPDIGHRRHGCLITDDEWPTRPEDVYYTRHGCTMALGTECPTRPEDVYYTRHGCTMALGTECPTRPKGPAVNRPGREAGTGMTRERAPKVRHKNRVGYRDEFPRKEQPFTAELHRLALDLSHIDEPMPESNPEALDFRVASGLFSGLRKWNKTTPETLRLTTKEHKA